LASSSSPSPLGRRAALSPLEFVVIAVPEGDCQRCPPRACLQRAIRNAASRYCWWQRASGRPAPWLFSLPSLLARPAWDHLWLPRASKQAAASSILAFVVVAMLAGGYRQHCLPRPRPMPSLPVGVLVQHLPCVERHPPHPCFWRAAGLILASRRPYPRLAYVVMSTGAGPAAAGHGGAT
jgi:hypothetical protein